MSQYPITPQNPEPEDHAWKGRTYLAGTIIGAIIGMITAYLFTRAAEEENENPKAKAQKISTAQMLSTAVAVMGVTRKIAELGKTNGKK